MKNKTEELLKQIKDLQEINSEMLSSIRLLENDNSTYNIEVNNLKNKLTKLKKIQEHSTRETEIPKEGSEQIIMEKNKILILCDEEGRSLGSLIYRQHRVYN
ncbi:hypothetical protein JTB14_018243 [Gonioctena quinquepunctata]|nr:hypothetical protein JTB14_018243 [Gonioctena quinquepunctata]